MKNMSFSLTTAGIRAKRKRVTRRVGWTKLKPGERFRAIVKGMGLRKGEKVERLCDLVCVSNRREPLQAMLDTPSYGRAECAREDFPHLSPREFVDFFKRTHRGVTEGTPLSRIEFDYA